MGLASGRAMQWARVDAVHSRAELIVGVVAAKEDLFCNTMFSRKLCSIKK
jgi:hypothetical protein